MKISRVTVFTAVLAMLSIPAAQAGTRQLAPGQSVEMVGQATVISTVHYQAMIFLICNGGGCFGDFKRPGANHQLNVSRVACNFSTSSGSTVSSSFISLINAVGATLVFERHRLSFPAPAVPLMHSTVPLIYRLLPVSICVSTWSSIVAPRRCPPARRPELWTRWDDWMTQPCQRSRGGSSELLLAASGLPGGRGPALLLSQMEKTKNAPHEGEASFNRWV